MTNPLPPEDEDQTPLPFPSRLTTDPGMRPGTSRAERRLLDTAEPDPDWPDAGLKEKEHRARHRSKAQNMIIFGLVLLLGGGLSVYLLPDSMTEAVPEEPALIHAGTVPVKEKPAQPGGLDIPYKDMTVFDTIGKSEQHAPTVEQLLPAPEAPKTEEITASAPAEGVPESAPAQPMTPAPSVTGQADVRPNAVADEPDAVETVPPQAPVAATPPQAESVPPAASPLVAEKPSPKLPEKKGVAKPVEPTPMKQEGAKTANPASYRVQLASFPDETKARGEAARFQSKYGAALGGVRLTVVRANLPGKGIYYRVQSTGITETKAREVCQNMKAARMGCILVKP